MTPFIPPIKNKNLRYSEELKWHQFRFDLDYPYGYEIDCYAIWIGQWFYIHWHVGYIKVPDISFKPFFRILVLQLFKKEWHFNNI